MSTKTLAALAIVLGLVIVAMVAAHLLIPFDSPKNAYVDPVYGFRFEVPDAFYEHEPIDGLYAYSVYFTSEDIDNDYRTMEGEDVQLMIRVSRDGSPVMSEVPTLPHVVTLERRETEVGGSPATEILVDATALPEHEVGCFLETSFEKAGRFHVITLSGTECRYVRDYRDEYDQAVGSFAY